MADENATETTAQPIAPAATPAPVVDDAEARYAQLEAEKENYRKAYLKEATRNKESRDDSSSDEESKMEEVARKVLADSRIAEIMAEQQTLIQTTLKQNKELKLAQLNRKEPAASVGSSTESTPVRDTLVTPEQMAYFKSKNYTDKDIERYKKNLQRNAR